VSDSLELQCPAPSTAPGSPAPRVAPRPSPGAEDLPRDTGMAAPLRLAARWLMWLASVVLLAGAAQAGVLTRDELARRFPPPLQVGEKLADIPAWPINSELTPHGGPVGYAFESIDLAPIPGFEGTPFNLLVAIDAQGTFTRVEVLGQHEPVFLSGLGEAPLVAFVGQYAGLNLRQSVTVSTLYGNRGAGTGDNQVVLDGVSKATASIRIVNQTVLTSALAVARAQLNMFSTAGQEPPARVRGELFERKDFAALLRDGDIVHRRWSNREVEALFAGTEAAGIDAAALAEPDDTFLDLYVGYASIPTIGRALLGDDAHAALMRQLEPGQHVWWVATAGRYPLVDPEFVRGTMPRRLQFDQDGAPLELRDADVELRAPAGAPPLNAMLVLRAPPLAEVDPGRAVRLGLDVLRARGEMFPSLTRTTLALDYAPPARHLVRPPAPLPEWLIAWQARGVDLAVIGIALAALAVVLARPRWLAVKPRRLAAFRLPFLAFTLVFIGWHAQGQLSIVQITGAVKTLAAGHGLQSFLYDPVSLLLIAFTAVTFVVWGRGTFCGWLCPFGALQEFVALAARRLGIRARRVPPGPARLLGRLPMALLAALVASAALMPALAEGLVEVEPFKTAITVGFDRSWPYVAWAAAMLLVGALYFKFFCRFLCPLGAAMALGGRLRRWKWLARRGECGQPCQTCRHRCDYDAIARDGRIEYDKCFQCLDCVGIYHDARRCAPLLFHARKGRDFRHAHRPRR